jgi:hypothetical protein
VPGDLPPRCAIAVGKAQFAILRHDIVAGRDQQGQQLPPVGRHGMADAIDGDLDGHGRRFVVEFGQIRQHLLNSVEQHLRVDRFREEQVRLGVQPPG